MKTGTRLGQYEILGPLGSGGMGDVYRARDLDLDREVAIKALSAGAASDPVLLARFEREARLLAATNHPNIATIYGVERSPGGPYLVMELLEGSTLARRLESGALALSDALGICIQIAHGVEAAHAEGIVHRDLKPSNIALLPDGRVKLLDFGIAKSLGTPAAGDDAPETSDETVAPELTIAGALVGTAPYMSPEQVRGQPVDARSDIWSFGCILYEALTGHRAFTADTRAELFAGILEREPDWSRLPARPEGSLRRLLERCLRKKPTERLHSMADGRLLLEELLADPHWEGRTLRPAHAGHRARFAAGGALIAAALVAVAFGFDAFGLRTAFLGASRLPAPASSERLESAADVRSVVAVPTEVAGSAEHAYLGDAVPAALSNGLGVLDGLEVRLPPTEVDYERVGRDRALIAESYAVDALLVSRFLLGPDQAVLQLELVDARRRTILWSGETRGTLDRYLNLLADSTRAVGAALRPDSQIPGAPMGASSDAELLYRRGRYQLDRFNHEGRLEDRDAARAALEGAFALLPNGRTAAALAFLHAISVDWDPATSDDRLPRALSWAERALELEPDTGLAWAMLARHQELGPEPDWRVAFEYSLRGARTPRGETVPLNMLGLTLASVAPELGVVVFERVARQDPLNPIPHLNLAVQYLLLARDAERGAALQQAERLQPEQPFTLALQVERLSGRRELEPAAEYLARLRLILEEGRIGYGPVLGAELQYRLAVDGRADALVDELLALPGVVDPDPGLLTWLAPLDIVLLDHGYREAAAGISQAASATGMFWPYETVALHAQLAAVRDDPDYAPLVARARERHAELIDALAAADERGELPHFLEQPARRLLERWEEQQQP